MRHKMYRQIILGTLAGITDFEFMLANEIENDVSFQHAKTLLVTTTRDDDFGYPDTTTQGYKDFIATRERFLKTG